MVSTSNQAPTLSCSWSAILPKWWECHDTPKSMSGDRMPHSTTHRRTNTPTRRLAKPISGGEEGPYTCCCPSVRTYPYRSFKVVRSSSRWQLTFKRAIAGNMRANIYRPRAHTTLVVSLRHNDEGLFVMGAMVMHRSSPGRSYS
jgi:hypothetical protein